MMVRIPVPVGVSPNIELVKWLMWAMRSTDWDVQIHESNAGIADARTQMCEDFLVTKHDHLWMIDADTVPPMRPLKGDQDVLCGMYQHLIYDGKDPVLVWSAWEHAEDGGYYPKVLSSAEKQPVDASGTGCMRISRKILEKVPHPWFENRYHAGSRHLSLGEDYDFCEKVRAAGGKVWVDPRYVCHHMKQASLSVVEKATVNTLVRLKEAA